jgi:undecaprenyl-diphosphatase
LVDYLNHLELNLCLRVNALSRREVVRRFFSIVSWLGNYPAWVLFGFIVAAQQGRATAIFAVQALATAFAGIFIYKMLKKRLVRERPYVTHGEIVCGTPPLDRYSFPSGHTLHAVCLTSLYGAYEPAMLIVMVPFAALVAMSRIVLGLHYPSDVAVGGLIGALLAAASLALTG